MIWHSTALSEVLQELQVDDKKGLSNGEADLRLDQYGKNVITKIESPTFLNRFAAQFKNRVVIILIAVALLSFVVSLMYSNMESYSSLLLIIIVALNALISAYYSQKCDKALEKIKQSANPTATVLRDSILKTINATDLVPGDIILLEAGDFIPADARIVECSEFRCNETTVTGESIPVDKNSDLILEDIATIENRKNMVFSGSNVVHGNAKAVVVDTGITTEVGRNSAILQQTGDATLPVQKKIDVIGKLANYIILGVCIFVFVLEIIQNFASANFALMTLDVLLNTVALAVAAIPEGLPAIATIVIAIGMQRIMQDNIILKDMSALELLGKTDVFCSDKTGVITRNKMILSRVFDGKNLTDVESDALNDGEKLILNLACACSTLENDSTEDAIEKACLTYNSMSKRDIDNMFPKLAEIPFDSERKSMTVITMINEQPFAIVKGAPEIVLPKCKNCDFKAILKLNEDLADEALRNVCIAMRKLDNLPANPNPDEIETDLTFVGLLSLFDPPREGIAEQISACKNAGIKTVMLTGDNLATAMAVAKEVGIFTEGDEAITGEELANMDDKELTQNIHKYSVFARIFPSDKLRIVKAWQKRKKTVTITGDSQQDADALAQADIGCAIGKFGNDVAKGNADIVISNNRFGSIVHALKESRGLFNNIKKSVYYMLSCNFAELLTVLFGIIIFPIPPISAVQLLWINLLTDCAPAISLSMETAEDSVMNSKTFSNNKIFDFKSMVALLIQSIFMAVITLVSFTIGFKVSQDVGLTMAFATLGITQIFHCLNNKFEGTVFNKRFFSNRFMNMSLLLMAFILIFLVFTPAGFLFGLTVLNTNQFFTALLLAFLIIPFTELLKFIKRKV